jgi:hypothetical protein
VSATAWSRARDGVVLLRLNRPERLNAINEELLRELKAACVAIGDDRAIRTVVLTGAGRGFCSGIDLRDFGPSTLDADDPAIDRLRFQEAMASLPLAIRALPQPVVAAVNGPAVGGGLALCLAADIRIAGSASFGNAAIALGLRGQMGMSYFLPRIVGSSVAADWMLTGRTVDAEAYRWGWSASWSTTTGCSNGVERRGADRCPLTPRRPDDQARAPGQHGRARSVRRHRGREPQPGHHARHRGGRRGARAMDEAMTGPLAGTRIVMMGGLGPAPFCGMLLGGLGADVVRVDRVTEVDQPPPIDTLMRRSQRSIAVDTKDPAAGLVHVWPPTPMPSSTCTGPVWPNGWASAQTHCASSILGWCMPA